MKVVRTSRQIAERFASEIAADDPLGFSPDGFDPLSATILIRSVAAEQRRNRAAEPTAWMSMTPLERAEIRPPSRQTATGVLRLIRGSVDVPVHESRDGEAA
ncbi:MAG TPA: hypothetical protein VFX16_09535 [Pseudonocardiaceae bacterium]|nr:hypothetical protein [Pseudonocardiaceae bacterium]